MSWVAVPMEVLARLEYTLDASTTIAECKPRRILTYTHVRDLMFVIRTNLEMEHISMDVGLPRIWQQAYKQL